MRARSVSPAAFGDRMNADASLDARAAISFGFERKAISPGRAASSDAIWRTRIVASPTSSPPSRATSSPREISIGERLLGFGQCLDHLVGDVDTRAGVDGFLEDDVVLLGLGDLLDRLVGTIKHAGELFVATLVQVFTELALLALKVTVEFVELPLLVAALALGHGHAVLLEGFLHALKLLGDPLQILVTLL